MSKDNPLSNRLHFAPVFSELVRRDGYVGFLVHQLAERFRDLAKREGLLSFFQHSCQGDTIREVQRWHQCAEAAWPHKTTSAAEARPCSSPGS